MWKKNLYYTTVIGVFSLTDFDANKTDVFPAVWPWINKESGENPARQKEFVHLPILVPSLGHCCWGSFVIIPLSTIKSTLIPVNMITQVPKPICHLQQKIELMHN